MGPEIKGEFTIISSFVQLSVLVLGFNTSYSIVYFLSRNRLNSNDTIKTVGLFNLFLSAIFICIVLLLNYLNLLSFLLPVKLNLYIFALLIAFFTLSLFTNSLSALHQSKKNFLFINKVNIYTAFVSLFFIASLSLIEMNETYKLVFCLVFLILPFLIKIPSFYIKSDLKLIKASLINKRKRKLFFGFGMLAYFANIFQFLNYRIDYWFIEGYYNLKELGYYALSSNLTSLLFVLPTTIAGIFFTYVSANTSSTNENYQKICRMLFFILTIIVLVLYFIASPLINSLYGNEFDNAVMPFKILIFSVPVFGITAFFASVISGKGKAKDNLMASGIGLIATLVFDLILIPKYGIIGAAYATLTSYMATSLYVFYIFDKISPLSFKSFFVLKRADIIEIKQLIYDKLKSR